MSRPVNDSTWDIKASQRIINIIFCNGRSNSALTLEVTLGMTDNKSSQIPRIFLSLLTDRSNVSVSKFFLTIPWISISSNIDSRCFHFFVVWHSSKYLKHSVKI